MNYCEECSNSSSGRCYNHQLRNTVVYPPLPEITLTAKGWECPKCGRVYSPSTAMCYFCPGSLSSDSNTK